jgi:NAD(P)H-hydrate repair Nnr-like enzyme with NAD(P)H-hydrate epimerase domain
MTQPVKKSRIISEQSEETRKLVELFAGMSINQEMSFKQASIAVGFFVNSTLSAYNSARNIVERDYDVVIEAIRGVGFKRASAKEIVTTISDRVLTRIRKSAKRGARKISVGISMNLTPENYAVASAKLNRFALLADVSAPARSNAKRVVTPETVTTNNREAFTQKSA